MGARGKITQYYEKFRQHFGFDSKLTYNNIAFTIKGSYRFIRNHLHN